MTPSLEPMRADELPADGIYEGVPFATYLRWPAVSRSGTLEPMRRSPAYYKVTKGTDAKRTSATILGSALNDLALQPHLFPDRFVLATICRGEKKNGDPCEYRGSVTVGGVCYCATHAKQAGTPDDNDGKMILSEESHALASAMAEAVRASEDAAPVLAAPGREVSLLWTDKSTGLRCKARLDICGQRNPIEGYVLADLKMSRSATPSEFSREVAKYGYHRQGAWYLLGLRVLGVVCDTFTDVVVANTAPHEVYVYDLIQDALVKGAEENRETLDAYARCVETSRWPSGGRFPLSLPVWAMTDDEEEASIEGAVEVSDG